MYNTEMPSRSELPSTARLIRSTVIAALVALVLLVTVVMPAEYALDPTGAGRLLGLTEMGEIKQQLADEALADQAALDSPPPVTAEPPPQEVVAPAPAVAAPEPEQEAPAEVQWRDEVRFVLKPGEGTEYKLTMQEGDIATYHWVSEGGPVNFDAHGDGGGRSISYEKGRGVAEDEGELQAVFSGNHGWFFRNRTSNDVTLVLRTRGSYGELKRAI